MIRMSQPVRWVSIAGITIITLVVADRARAQYAPVFGYGGWGSSYAWMASNSGMNAAAQAAQARYQVQTAQMARAYQQAALMQQAAAAAAAARENQGQPMQERYNAHTGAGMASRKGRAADSPAPRIDQLLTASGKPRWPIGAAAGKELLPMQQAADQAIAAVFEEYKANGQASVASVSDAKQKLGDYGHPALTRTVARNRAQGNALLTYLQNLDRALEAMGGVTQ